jgi:hypothetical protein
MDSLHFNFTKKALLNLPVCEKATTFHDIGKRGLKLLVQSTGTKTFILYRKINGKPERITIGRFPDISIEQARKQADKLNAKITEGINPN